MNNHADQEKLLADILAESSPAGFRATLLAETLHLAQQRRRLRQVRRTSGVILLAGLLTIVVMQRFSKSPIISPSPAAATLNPAYHLVRTRPMPVTALVNTGIRSAVQLVTTMPSVIEIATMNGEYRLINDNELLAMLADKPAALIRTGPHSEELVFASPADQKLLQSN